MARLASVSCIILRGKATGILGEMNRDLIFVAAILFWIAKLLKA